MTPDTESTWYFTALSEAENKCCNCGSDDRLSVKLIVPEESGGNKVPSNCTVLCKNCRFLSDKPNTEGRIPTSFFISMSLHKRLTDYSQQYNVPIASIIRVLINVFVSRVNTGTYENIWAYQESDRDVKINVQVDSKSYEIFKEVLREERRTVQEAMAALLNYYLERENEEPR